MWHFRIPKLTILDRLVMLAIVAVLLALLLSPAQVARDGLRQRVRGAMHHIAWEIHRREENGENLFDLEDRRFWRLALLRNSQLIQHEVSDYSPLMQIAAKLDHLTGDFFHFCGSESRESPRVCYEIRGLSDPDSIWRRSDLSLSNIPDGAANTILLVAIRDSGHSWSEPWEPGLQDLYRLPYFGAEGKGLLVALTDGSVCWLPPSLSKKDLQELISPDGDADRSVEIMQKMRGDLTD